jgi:RimJ/RimL family protein N-acetyltransferase
MSDAGRALVDGLGASRVALALLAAAGGLALRPAAAADARTMWTWRNAPATRAASRTAQDIPFEDHARWLDRALADPARRLAIAAVGPRDVGVLRFDRLAAGGPAWEVSLYLDPALHGLGLGGALLAAGEADLRRAHGDAVVHAEVLPDNAASRRLFLAAGYRAEGPTAFSKSLAPATAAGAPSAESTR